MEKKMDKFIFWTPRILSIMFSCFLVVFSFDVFGMELSFWQTIGALLMHNIPSFILLSVSIISWKHEIVGGIVFTLAGLLYILMLVMTGLSQWGVNIIFVILFIPFPVFLIGILFLIGWFKKRKELKPNFTQTRE